jgi:hypothetical protein
MGSFMPRAIAADRVVEPVRAPLVAAAEPAAPSRVGDSRDAVEYHADALAARRKSCRGEKTLAVRNSESAAVPRRISHAQPAALR